MVSALGALMRNSVLSICERGLKVCFRVWTVLGAIDSITSVSVKWCLSEDYTNRSIWISVSVFATGGFVVFALIPSSIFMFIEGRVLLVALMPHQVKITKWLQ